MKNKVFNYSTRKRAWNRIYVHNASSPRHLITFWQKTGKTSHSSHGTFISWYISICVTLQCGLHQVIWFVCGICLRQPPKLDLIHLQVRKIFCATIWWNNHGLTCDSEQRFHFLLKGESLIISQIPQIGSNGLNVSCVPLTAWMCPVCR